MNEEILRLLYQRGDFLSGEELSEMLGISRTAVWKRIGKLKEEGYDIESVTNRGYRLGTLNGKAYGWALSDRFEETKSSLWKRLVFQEELDSSNLEAKRLIAENAGAEGTVITCEKQTAGRGRRGRVWESPAGSGIWMSMILKPNIPTEKAPMLTILSGMAVREALENLYGIPAAIKWPNDIIVHDKKICGILTEMTMEDMEITGVIPGIGINVLDTAFPEELKDKATSVTLETKQTPNRVDIFMEVLKCFERLYPIFLQTLDLSGLAEEYNRHCINIGREVYVIRDDSTEKAEALGIDRDGGLRIRTEEGEKTVSSGEVTIRGVMGYAR